MTTIFCEEAPLNIFMKTTLYAVKSMDHFNYFCEDSCEWVADIKYATLYSIPPKYSGHHQLVRVELQDDGTVIVRK